MTFDGVSDFIKSRKTVQAKPDGFGEIEKFVKARQASDPVEQLGLVESFSRFLEDYKEKPRRPGIHVSEIAYKFCPVKWVLGKIAPKKRQIPYRLRYRFAVGTALHEMIQGYLGEMGILKGFWKCENNHVTKEISLKPEACAVCGGSQSYVEIELSHEIRPGHNIVGSTDGVMLWQGEDIGLEIKSLEPHVLSSMNKPYPYPIVQLNIYMHLLKMKLFPNMKRGIVLLAAPMDKDSILLPMKSFYIDYTDAYWKDASEKVVQAIEFLDAFKEGKLTAQALITKRVCASRTIAGKAECEQVLTCFDTGALVTTLKTAYAALQTPKSGT
jgi:hypothetical protein